MASSGFVQLSGALIEAMGQRMDAVKPIEEGVVLRTGDRFLYAFLEDPARVSLETVRRLFDDGGVAPVHVVVLTPGHLPLAISAEVVRRTGTLVEGPRFAELARQLGLGAMLGDAPRAAPTEARRLLPSAQQLDEVMRRARTWLDWGVPALALRFFRQASDMKPGFLPARVGVGQSLLALRLVDEADRQFDEVLKSRPEDVEARLGKAAVLGARAQPQKEVELYRTLLQEDEARTEVRAHLLAALIELGDWRGARVEVEAMLVRTPEEPQLRFLHAVALTRTGEKALGEEEREEARRLGLSFEREEVLCRHLGLPAPAPPATAPAATSPAPEGRATPSGGPARATKGPRRTSRKPAGSARRTSPVAPAKSKRANAHRKRK